MSAPRDLPYDRRGHGLDSEEDGMEFRQLGSKTPPAAWPSCRGEALFAPRSQGSSWSRLVSQLATFPVASYREGGLLHRDRAAPLLRAGGAGTCSRITPDSPGARQCPTQSGMDTPRENSSASCVSSPGLDGLLLHTRRLAVDRAPRSAAHAGCFLCGGACGWVRGAGAPHRAGPLFSLAMAVTLPIRWIMTRIGAGAPLLPASSRRWDVVVPEATAGSRSGSRSLPSTQLLVAPLRRPTDAVSRTFANHCLGGRDGRITQE